MLPIKTALGYSALIIFMGIFITGIYIIMDEREANSCYIIFTKHFTENLTVGVCGLENLEVADMYEIATDTATCNEFLDLCPLRYPNAHRVDRGCFIELDINTTT